VIEDGRGEGQAVTFGDPHRIRAGSPGLAEAVSDALAEEEAGGFSSSARAVAEIEQTWLVMRETVEQLPEG
jgi:hypothetical protein